MPFFTRNIRTLKDVVDWRLCCGCGACRYALPEGEVELRNIESLGIRPYFTGGRLEAAIEDHDYCPGYAVNDPSPIGPNHEEEFGHTLGIWEGHAADPEIRFKASSGGILSALALYCLEKEGMSLVLHPAMDGEKPWLYKTYLSRSRQEIVGRAGSRYAPSSPCDSLKQIEAADGPLCFYWQAMRCRCDFQTSKKETFSP